MLPPLNKNAGILPYRYTIAVENNAEINYFTEKIIDGIVGMEGDGPIMGTPIEHGVLLVSDNCPAADAEAVRLMGMDPWKFDYYRIAATMGGTISPLKTEIVGDAIEPRTYAVLDQFTWLRG